FGCRRTSSSSGSTPPSRASAGEPGCAEPWSTGWLAVGRCAAVPGTAGTCWYHPRSARLTVAVTHSRRVEPPAARIGRPRGRGARMTESSRTSLRRVLDDLGRSVLEVVGGPAGAATVDGPDGRVGGVVILDPLDPPLLPPRAIVLA